MNLESWLHFIHILGAIIWVGGGMILCLLGIRAQQSKDAHLIGDFAKTLSYVGLRLLMPAVVMVLVSGVWQVLISSESNFTQLWVLLGLGLFIVAILIGAIYLSRIAMQLERVATGTDADAEAVSKILSRWIVGYGFVLVILLVAVWDMVFKPGL